MFTKMLMVREARDQTLIPNLRWTTSKVPTFIKSTLFVILFCQYWCNYFGAGGKTSAMDWSSK